MQKKISNCAFTIILTLIFFNSNAQSVIDFSKDLSTINVDNYSDKEIKEISYELKKKGYTINDLEKLAVINNMPTTEIVKLKERINKLELDSDTNLKTKTDQSLASPILKASKRITSYSTNEKELEIFGSYLFNSQNLTFEPNSNLSTPENYQLGAGDEIVIEIWGASKQTYQKTINRNGAIVIENIGPIYLNGYSIETASKKIINQLSNLYSGIKGSNPNTYADVSLGKLRSIKVNIIGEVKSPGTYTLSSVSTIFNALYFCGGPFKSGSLRSVELFRNNRLYKTLDIYDFLIEGSQKDNIVLKDNDIIRINPYVKRVKIKGEVKRQGVFELLENENFAKLLKFTAGFTEEAFTERIKIVRVTPTEKKILTINKSGFDTFTLKNGDVITIESILDRYSNRVTIKGAVMREGDYELTPNLKVHDLISKSEGLREDAFLDRAKIFRLKNDLTTEVIPIDLKNGDTLFILKKDDILFVSSIFELKEDYTVSISGSIQNPGDYPYFINMGIKDLVSLAGGFKESASSNKIEVARRIKGFSTDTKKLAEVFEFNFDKNLSIDRLIDSFKLEPFDQIFIRNIPNYQNQQIVNIEGEVLYPGRYALSEKEENISSLIKRAGGLTPYAYPEGASLSRIKGDSFQKIGIDLNAILIGKKHSENLRLYQSDVLYIPKELQTVSISGEVYFESATTYYKNYSFKKYISEAGGFSSKALKRKTYIKYANGKTKRTKSFIGIKFYPKIEPGTEIFVPAKPEKREVSVQEIISISTGVSTLSLVIISLLNAGK